MALCNGHNIIARQSRISEMMMMMMRSERKRWQVLLCESVHWFIASTGEKGVTLTLPRHSWNDKLKRGKKVKKRKIFLIRFHKVKVKNRSAATSAADLLITLCRTLSNSISKHRIGTNLAFLCLQETMLFAQNADSVHWFSLVLGRWVFYFFLATLHLVHRTLTKNRTRCCVLLFFCQLACSTLLMMCLWLFSTIR